MKFIFYLMIISQMSFAASNKTSDWMPLNNYGSSQTIKEASFRKIGKYVVEIKISGFSQLDNKVYSNNSSIIDISKLLMTQDKSSVVGLMKVDGFKNPIIIIYNNQTKSFEYLEFFNKMINYNQLTKEKKLVIPAGLAFTASITFPVK